MFNLVTHGDKHEKSKPSLQDSVMKHFTPRPQFFEEKTKQ